MLINNVKALFWPGVIVYALVHKLQDLGVYCIIMSNNFQDFQFILVPYLLLFDFRGMPSERLRTTMKLDLQIDNNFFVL